MNEKVNKDKVRIRVLLLTSIILLLALITVLALALTGAFFNGGNENAVNDILLGQTTKITLNEGASATTLSFNGSALPGDVYQQNINLTNPYQGNISFVRASFYVINSNGNKNAVEVSVMEDWIKADDGYFYYDHLMNKGQTVSLTKTIKIPTDIVLNSDKVYNIVVMVEALEQNIDISKIWTTAPVDLIANNL